MLSLSIFLHQERIKKKKKMRVRKNKKMMEGPSFETAHRVLTCLVTLRPQMPHLCSFLDCFSLSYFLVTYCRFSNLRLNSLNFALKFRYNKPNFCHLDVLVQKTMCAVRVIVFLDPQCFGSQEVFQHKTLNWSTLLFLLSLHTSRAEKRGQEL